MQSRSHLDLYAAATEGETLAVETELSILRDISRMRPAGVRVQEENGGSLLVNDAAAEQLGIAAGDPALPPSQELPHRRETCLELLRTGRPTTAEESVFNGPVKQVLLTSHRPVRIAERNLLLSSSADISEQKAVEDHLFRSAYYDELTGLPTRRLIDHRPTPLLQPPQPHCPFPPPCLALHKFH